MNLLIKGLGVSTFLMLGLGQIWLGTPAWGQTLPLEAGLTSLTSRTGESLLETSQAKADVLLLISHFVTQINPAYCGVASSVMVLNALGVTKEMGCKPRTLGRLCYNRDRKSATSPESRTVEWRNLEDQGKQQREGISQRTLGEGKVIGLPAIQGILALLYTQATGRGGCQNCGYTGLATGLSQPRQFFYTPNRGGD
ncbi:phytochelatin synthase family protein [Thermosynechococcaceae cyanobacterium BACA0444]|uniref:glutathione gamma-glutamylcysteinyltransferase n=1 Tax=Pseudocalidococcus azoricus BACA0444 TaxID=2918990 RepID=A0AAE4FP42_9CYAN|nr:phytochelatin synthase family protein [Pseudocalidococcus azoricus]MDS3859546.1 phytochelatin synthase family protein [Pseudocalidococcus azoricus BACA0444]